MFVWRNFMTDDCPAVFWGAYFYIARPMLAIYKLNHFRFRACPSSNCCVHFKICCSPAHHSFASFITSLSKTKYLIQLQALNLVSQRGGPYLLLENGTFISLSKSKISTVTRTYPVLLSGSQFVQWFLICPYLSQTPHSQHIKGGEVYMHLYTGLLY